VGLRVQEKVRPFIKKGAIASISSEGLMGDKLVAISSGTGSKSPVNDGDTISTIEPMQLDRVMDRISSVAENAEVITGELAGIVTQVNKGKGSVGRLLYSDSLAKSLEGTISEAKGTMRSAHKGAEGFSDNMEALKHNFLLRGYFKKKEKAQKKAEEEEKKENKADEKLKKAKGKDSTTVKIEKEQ
jgi:phospholipid/cholesterol/gamma-HCH transport system substrate-binding protein